MTRTPSVDRDGGGAVLLAGVLWARMGNRRRLARADGPPSTRTEDVREFRDVVVYLGEIDRDRLRPSIHP